MLDRVGQLHSGSLVKLDRIDLNILRQLSLDAGTTNANLADTVGLSASACLQRVRRLEKQKIIRGYVAEVDWRQVYAPARFLTHIRLNQHRRHDFQQFEKYILESRHAVFCYSVGGEIDYIVLFMCTNIEEYHVITEELIDSALVMQNITSYVVMKDVKLDAGRARSEAAFKFA